MNKLNKGIFLTASVLSLSACGGGSDGGGDDGNTSVTPPPPPPSYSMSVNAAQSVEENGSLNVEVVTSGGEGSESLSASIKQIEKELGDETGAAGSTSDEGDGGDDTDVTFEPTDTGFVFHFGEASYKQDEYIITIEATKGDETESEELEVAVNNTSGNKAFAYVSSVQEVLPAQRQFIAEWLMVERLVKGVNLSGGDIDIKDIKPLYITATSGDGVDNNALFSVYVNDDLLTGYQDNSLKESEAFSSFFENVSSDTCESPRCLTEHLMRVKPMFDYVFERSGGVIQEPAYGDVGFDAGTGTFSIFYTAPDNGDFDAQGNWTFKPEYEYLADIIVAGHEAAGKFSAAE